jgi:hypothetical protein
MSPIVTAREKSGVEVAKDVVKDVVLAMWRREAGEPVRQR